MYNMSFFPEGPDNKSIKETRDAVITLSNSSEKLELLTLILIFFTFMLSVLTLASNLNTIVSHFFISLIIMLILGIFALVFLGYRKHRRR